MIRGWRQRREFKREAKRLADEAEPQVREASVAIYENYVDAVEFFAERGFTAEMHPNFLKPWMVEKKRLGRFKR